MIVVAGLLAACAAPQSGKDTEERTGSAAAPAASPGAEAARADDAPSRPDSSDARATLLIVGTSLTAGLGLDPAEAYPALIQRKVDSAGFAVRVVNAGLSGETSAGALRRIDWLLQNPADLIMVETGANDGLRGLDVDSTRQNLRDILARARRARPGAPLFLAQMEAPPNLGPAYTSRFREMFAQVAREFGATLVPFLLDGVAGVPRLNQGDGIHPNEEGARLVAENVWRTLAPALAQRAEPNR